MEYLLLSIVLVCAAVNVVAQKQYAIKNTHPASPVLFNIETALVMLIAFLVLNRGRYVFHLPTVGYAVAFSVGFILFAEFGVKAVGSGPLGITNLLLQYSLILPTAAGVLFWNEKITFGRVAGIVLFLFSLGLLNLRANNGEKPPTWRWGICVTLAFLGNGICAITQKMQQRAFPQQYRCEFMMTAMVFAMLLGIFHLIPMKKDNITAGFRQGIGWVFLYAIGNSAINFLVMMLCVRMSASIMFPTIAAGGILLNLLIAFIIYREKFSRTQVAAFFFGMISLILLNW